MSFGLRIFSSTRLRHTTIVSAVLAGAILAATPVLADDVKMFKTAPSVDELQNALTGGAPKTKIKTRAIVFGDDAAAEEPAAAPQAQPQVQAQPQPQAAPASYQPAANDAPQAAPARQNTPKPQRVAAKQSAPAPVAASEKAVGFPINFDVNSATIRPDSIPFLDAIGGLLQKDPSMRMLVEGHTDASGSYARNVELSKTRAEAVVNFLIARYNVDPSRLMAMGKGPKEPLNPATPTSPDNRRVQFRILG